MQNMFESHIAESLVEKIDDLVSVSSSETILDGTMYVYHREKIPLAQKRRVILTAKGLFVVNRKRSDIDSDQLFADLRVNTAWATVLFASKVANPDSEFPFPFNISFVLKGSIVNFYLISEQAFQQWKRALSTVGIQTNFAEKFAVVRPIGKGSSASVFEITERETGSRSACKVFSKKALLKNTKQLKGLINEITILQDVQNHPNILQLREIHETETNIYLITELVEGDKVFDKKFERQFYEMADFQSHELCNVIESLLAALLFLKEKNIVHRDLKPQNMLLKYKDRPFHSNEIKIIDFGLATYYSSENQLFTNCGTVGYMAPEVLRSEGRVQISPAMDIYSLGIILYNFITGTKAFKTDSLKNSLQNNKRGFINFYHPSFEQASPDCNLISTRPYPANVGRRS
jgi:serine/threonine protein kinase